MVNLSFFKNLYYPKYWFSILYSFIIILDIVLSFYKIEVHQHIFILLLLSIIAIIIILKSYNFFKSQKKEFINIGNLNQYILLTMVAGFIFTASLINSSIIQKDHFLLLINNLFFLLIAISLSLVIYLSNPPWQKIENINDNKKILVTKESIFVFDTMFGIIAAFAITEALEKYSEILIGDLISDFINTLGFVSFFFVAIPFYHSSIILLTNSSLMFRNNRSPKNILLHFAILLIQSSLLFFMAINIGKGNLFFFSILISFLIVEILWHLFEYRILKREIMPTHWLFLNSITIILLYLMILTLFLQPPEIENISVIIAFNFSGFIIVLLRSILNYHIGWKHIYLKGFGFEEE